MRSALFSPRSSLFGPPRRELRLRPSRLPLIYRWLEETAETLPQGENVRDAVTALVEAVLLTADEPLPPRKLAKAAGIDDTAEVRKILRRLQAMYERDGTAFQIEEIAGGFQLLTRPEYHRWLVRLRSSAQDMRLTGPARETLAIVAYRQPIMRAEIEAIRGVHCGETLRLLMERGLIRIAGRHDSLGRPVLYGTTKKFLQVYGLKSLKELPQVEELKEPEKGKRKTESSAAEEDASEPKEAE